MAGLLDYNVDPIGQGLLQMGAAMMTPRAMGGGMGPGLLAFNQGAMQAQQFQRQLSRDALLEKLYGAQIKRYEADAAKDMAAVDADKAKRAGMQSVLTDIAGRTQPQFDFRAASASANAGTPYAPAVPQGPVITQADVAKWVALGGDPKQLEAIVASKDWGLSKVKDYVTMAGPNGPRKQGMDEFGRRVGEGFDEPVKYNMVNLGDRMVPVNEYVPPTQPLMMGQSPDNKATVGATIRGQNITAGTAANRLAFDREQANRPTFVESLGGYVSPPTKAVPTGGFTPVPGVNAGPKPTWDSERGVWVSPPSASTPTGSFTAPTGTAGAQLPAKPDPTAAKDARQRETNANDAAMIAKEVQDVLDQGGATGSLGGWALNQGAQAFGVSTKAGQDNARLAALSGALVAKMPRMEGPQSNYDVDNYKEMAGRVGNPRLPIGDRLAALEEVVRLQYKYGAKPVEGLRAPKRAGGNQNVIDFNNLGQKRPAESPQGPRVINFGDLTGRL